MGRAHVPGRSLHKASSNGTGGLIECAGGGGARTAYRVGMSETPPNETADFDTMARDIAEVPAVEVIVTVAVNLMSAAAVKLGLTEEGDQYKDLDEARKLVHALAGLLDAGATEISSFHAAPLRDGLKSLQLAFREASIVPDAPGQGPGEKYTGAVFG
ncbi:hypothetical protein DWB77_06150 [Streptomyces hundungensis]|uniref:DUF1844 domain-containing protein n=2 Tax=Streptomyces TaxID=1883 RepID=A0A387HR34_9ACTN|nr:hypothetical protein DWB77_06150 [Streptomyces hundungensis]